jgi:hypothetical protein
LKGCITRIDKNAQWLISTGKDAKDSQHHMSLGKCPSKPQGFHHLRPARMAQLKPVLEPVLAKMERPDPV